MSADRDIDEWLRELGFGLPEALGKGRAALEAAQLTRPGKKRMSDEKLTRAAEELSRQFFLHCESPACRAVAQQSGRAPLRADRKSACGACSGSDNRRAEASFVDACRERGVRRVVIVGGSPAVRDELAQAVGKALELRMIDGTERRTSDRARADVDWADLVLLWGASELHHKVSWLYTQAPAARNKVVHVAKRGVAALLQAGVEHLRTRS